MKEPQHTQPLWETIVMIVSFVLLWVWFLVRQSVHKTPGAEMSPLWTVLLVAVAVTLLVIMFRRFRRVKRALEGKDPYGDGDEREPVPGFTFPGVPGMPPPMLDGKRHGAGELPTETPRKKKR
jgi:hypothetical protein